MAILSTSFHGFVGLLDKGCRRANFETKCASVLWCTLHLVHRVAALESCPRHSRFGYNLLLNLSRVHSTGWSKGTNIMVGTVMN